MRSHVRISLLALLAGAIVALTAPAAAQAAFGVEKFVSVTCDVGAEECANENVAIGPPFGTFSVPKEPSVAEAEAEGYTQAGGRVPFGITHFKLNTEGSLPFQKPQGAPVTHIRTDVAPGLATSPAAVPQCTEEEFGNKEAIPGTHFYTAPTCKAETEIGINKATVFAEGVGDLALEGAVYNLVQKEGLASEFGVALKLPKFLTEAILAKVFKGTQPGLEKEQYFAHTLIEGSVEWGKEEKGTNQGDYHDYFEIEVSPALPLISSRLVFFGRAGNGAFITNATRCPGNTTTTLKLTNAEETVAKAYTTPIGLSGCNLIPFDPTFSLTPAVTGQEDPNGFTTEAGIPHDPTKIDDSQLKEAVVTLPEGMTLNPSAAAGLEACTPAQARIHSSVKGVACPSGSELGTFNLEVPTLPPGSLTGKMYLGGPESGPITGPPYIVYLDAESERFGVSVRIKGETIPNPVTGRVTTVFNELPEQPFTNAVLHFKEGPLAPVANPLTCGAAATGALFAPFSEQASKSLSSAFTVTGCPATIPFALTQSTQNQTGNAGGKTSFTFNLARKDGNQYLQKVSTTLPAGLVGAIPLVTQCAEAEANAGTCPSSSQIGTATVAAGAGPTPFTFSGPVYLTGPYQGAPFGLSIVVPAVAGPFNLGNVVTRATINVDQFTARVIATSTLPTIVKGIPIRLKNVSVAVNKQGFLFNPTSCSPLSTDSTLTSTFGATQSLSTPLQLGNCGALAFKPSFKAKVSARVTKKNGTSLETTLNLPTGGSNVKSVLVTLPIALPSRLTTLQKACPEATFKANPFSCPSGSFVGGARANTPTLPSKLKGPAILVSHGGAAFPDLDLVLEANGVRVILVGNTDIKKGITTTNFAATPDAPVTSITVNLPAGSHSALTGHGNLCRNRLLMPTTITGQNGAMFKQKTKIKVTGCGVQIVGKKVIRRTAYLTVRTFAAGRISGKGKGVKTVFRRLFRGPAKAVRLKVRLRAGVHGHKRVRIRVGFVPKNRKVGKSTAFVTVRFR